MISHSRARTFGLFSTHLSKLAFVAGGVSLTPNPSPRALGEGSGLAKGPGSIIVDFL